MQLDFAAILVILAVVTGGVWLIDMLFLAPRRARSLSAAGATTQGNGPGAGPEVDLHGGEPLPWYIDFSRSFFPVIIAVLILRSFIVEPFRIPSSSMEPTLFPGDFILVNKFAYGLRLPVSNQKFIDLGQPERGDVVVFRYPSEPSQAFIKRIVATPGDTLEYRNKQLTVNGEPVLQQPLEQISGDGYFSIRMEKAGNKEYKIQADFNSRDRDFTLEIPPEQYFVMGDNRDNSSDSRVWGFMPKDNLIGKAFFIWMNLDCITFNGNCSRIGSTIE